MKYGNDSGPATKCDHCKHHTQDHVKFCPECGKDPNSGDTCRCDIKLFTVDKDGNGICGHCNKET